MNLEEILKSTAILVGLITAFRAYIEYRRAQRWKRAEFLSKEAKEFFSDPVNRNALYMLDWSVREIVFTDPTGEKIIETVTREDIIDALKKHTEKKFNKKERLIRDTFGDFFDNLQRFEQYLEAGLFTKSDFSPYIQYWADHLNFRVREDMRLQIHEFLVTYEYDQVIKLLARYNRKPQH